MREVAIIGAGQTPVAEHWDKSMARLAGLAVRSAMQDAEVERVDALFVGNMMAEAVNRQQNLGAQVAAVSGLRGVEATRLDAACGSGASAFRAGINAVASGAAEVVAVVGVEKVTYPAASGGAFGSRHRLLAL